MQSTNSRIEEKKGANFTCYDLDLSLFHCVEPLQSPHSRSWTHRLHKLVPITEWLPKYSPKKQLKGDLLAGVTVAVMTIPQGMAYASLAQLPPVYGLYAALVPFFLYPIFGGSKFVIMGLVAVKYVSSNRSYLDLTRPYSSMLTGNSVIKYHAVGSQSYIDAVLIMSFYAGIFSLSFALLRIGKLLKYLSQSLLLGFTSGSACVIILSQIEALFGLKAEKSEYSIVQCTSVNLDRVYILTPDTFSHQHAQDYGADKVDRLCGWLSGSGCAHLYGHEESKDPGCLDCHCHLNADILLGKSFRLHFLISLSNTSDLSILGSKRFAAGGRQHYARAPKILCTKYHVRDKCMAASWRTCCHGSRSLHSRFLADVQCFICDSWK